MTVFPDGCDGCGCLNKCLDLCLHKGTKCMNQCPCPECIVKVNCSKTCLEFDIFVETIFHKNQKD